MKDAAYVWCEGLRHGWPTSNSWVNGNQDEWEIRSGTGTARTIIFVYYPIYYMRVVHVYINE